MNTLFCLDLGTCRYQERDSTLCWQKKKNEIILQKKILMMTKVKGASSDINKYWKTSIVCCEYG